MPYKYLWCVGDSILLGAPYQDLPPFDVRSIVRYLRPELCQIGTQQGGHDCYAGYRTDQLASGVLSWGTEIETPDLVWIYAGANDILQSSGFEMGRLVDNVISIFPNAEIILSRIAIVRTVTPEATYQFNSESIDSLGLPSINFEESFSSEDYVSDMIHFNITGQTILAEKFSEGITKYI